MDLGLQSLVGACGGACHTFDSQLQFVETAKERVTRHAAGCLAGRVRA